MLPLTSGFSERLPKKMLLFIFQVPSFATLPPQCDWLFTKVQFLADQVLYLATDPSYPAVLRMKLQLVASKLPMSFVTPPPPLLSVEFSSKIEFFTCQVP